MTIVSMGELLIDFVALESGVTVGEASGFLRAPGGAPANVAVAVARLGHPSAFLGQVGDDPFGRALADVLRRDGVDVSGLRYSTEARTMLAFVALGEGGERSFSFYRNPSADMLMTPADVATDVIDNADLFHFGSITMIDEPARSATLAAAQRAQERGLLISYDPNLRMALWPDEDAARDGMLQGMEYAHIVKVSEEELIFLTGEASVDALWRDQMQLIVVTRGADGAVAYTRDGAYEHPGYSVQPVDTTGAGDGFVAGLLVSLLERGAAVGKPLPDVQAALPFANAVGAITTTKKGAIPALPTRQQVEVFIAQH